jgi:hypothetical protein
MRVVLAPTVKEAIRRLRAIRAAMVSRTSARQGGRPKGTYTIDTAEATILAIVVDYGGLRRRSVLDELGRHATDDSYQWLRRRIDRGRRLISQGNCHGVPHELRSERLQSLSAEAREQRCCRAVRALRST